MTETMDCLLGGKGLDYLDYLNSGLEERISLTIYKTFDREYVDSTDLARDRVDMWFDNLLELMQANNMSVFEMLLFLFSRIPFARLFMLNTLHQITEAFNWPIGTLLDQPIQIIKVLFINPLKLFVRADCYAHELVIDASSEVSTMGPDSDLLNDTSRSTESTGNRDLRYYGGTLNPVPSPITTNQSE